jgi:hypothetical protein
MVPSCYNYLLHGDCHFLGLPYAQHTQFVVSHVIILIIKLQICIYFIFQIHIKYGWSVINLDHEEFTNLHLAGSLSNRCFQFYQSTLTSGPHYGEFENVQICALKMVGIVCYHYFKDHGFFLLSKRAI